MSLTAHLASMPRRAEATASEESIPERSRVVKPNWVASAIRRAAKALVMLTGVVLGAITTFTLWMWWPQVLN